MSAAAVVIQPPKVPCFRCKKSHDTAAAFLMACCKCERAWHHTCHIPPVAEDEIMRRLKADQGGKRDAGLRSWQCRTCTKKRRLEAEHSTDTRPSPAPPAERPSLSREHVLQSSSKPPQSLPTPIVLDDDDDIVILDGPPPAVGQPSTGVRPHQLPPSRPVEQARELRDANTGKFHLDLMPCSGNGSIPTDSSGARADVRASKQTTRDRSVRPSVPPAPHNVLKGHKPASPEHALASPPPHRPQQDAPELPHGPYAVRSRVLDNVLWLLTIDPR
ncbi:hypothetical protein C8T65DRAFT_658435 [Cerioporus squamosus]|nr:hypothetical protein C8T65DRAFT_658435 [Cerioporus squamosus]